MMWEGRQCRAMEMDGTTVLVVLTPIGLNGRLPRLRSLPSLSLASKIRDTARANHICRRSGMMSVVCPGSSAIPVCILLLACRISLAKGACKAAKTHNEGRQTSTTLSKGGIDDCQISRDGCAHAQTHTHIHTLARKANLRGII